MIGGLWWASKDIVPFKDIGFGGMRDDVWRRVFSYGFVFAGELALLVRRSQVDGGGGKGDHTRLLAARVAMMMLIMEIGRMRREGENGLEVAKSGGFFGVWCW